MFTLITYVRGIMVIEWKLVLHQLRDHNWKCIQKTICLKKPQCA